MFLFPVSLDLALQLSCNLPFSTQFEAAKNCRLNLTDSLMQFRFFQKTYPQGNSNPRRLREREVS